MKDSERARIEQQIAEDEAAVSVAQAVVASIDRTLERSAEIRRQNIPKLIGAGVLRHDTPY